MNSLEAITQYCPYCGEPVELFIDCSVPRQEYIEDCRVCCQPIIVTAEIGTDGTPFVSVRSEND